MIIHSCSDMPLLAYADADWALARIAVVPPLANWHSKGRLLHKWLERCPCFAKSWAQVFFHRSLGKGKRPFGLRWWVERGRLKAILSTTHQIDRDQEILSNERDSPHESTNDPSDSNWHRWIGSTPILSSVKRSRFVYAVRLAGGPRWVVDFDHIT